MDIFAPHFRKSHLLISLIFLSLLSCKTLAPYDTTSVSAQQSVDFAKELVITDPDIVRKSAQSISGSWRFRNVIKELAGAGTDAETDTFFENWANEWEISHAFNNDEASPRGGIKTLLLDAWKHDRIDLIAIVNRIDLTRFLDNKIGDEVLELGEGRLVYEVVNQGNFITSFTIILEFKLPNLDASLGKKENLRLWAEKWHELGRNDIDLDERLKKLEAITIEYTRHGNLKQVRTNELAADFANKWEMREFTLKNGMLKLHTLGQTPRDSARTDSNSIAELKNYIDKYVPEILDGSYNMSKSPEGKSLQGIKSQFDASFPTPWKVPNANQQALYTLSFNTCNGCHKTTPGLNTENQHIFRDPNGDRNKEAKLSPFLTDISTVNYPLPGCEIATMSASKPWCDAKTWNEREMRETLMKEFLVITTNKDSDNELFLTNNLIEVMGFRVH